jgi:hypothetical protein
VGVLDLITYLLEAILVVNGLLLIVGSVNLYVASLAHRHRSIHRSPHGPIR